MPQVDTLVIPLWIDPIPWDVPIPVELLARPAMSPVSTLFHAPQFWPITCRTLCSAPNKVSAAELANRMLALRRKTVTIDDGIVKVPGTLVLGLRSFLADAGLVIGGNAVGDRWTVETTWTFLPDADLDSRA